MFKKNLLLFFLIFSLMTPFVLSLRSVLDGDMYGGDVCYLDLMEKSSEEDKGENNSPEKEKEKDKEVYLFNPEVFSARSVSKNLNSNFLNVHLLSAVADQPTPPPKFISAKY
ncbi:MAG: hypothetical protein K2X86_01035 [Cytophagaceae bacterium]|nr:hypothetical protein [Cytophagaceae bacterium]